MYIDANIIVYAMTDAGMKSRSALELLDEVENGRHAVISPLVVDEVIWTMLRQKLPLDFIATAVEEIYEVPNLEIKDLPAIIPLEALKNMKEHKLKPRDAFHLAIMQHFNITEIVSNDKDFDRIPGINRIKL